MKKGLSYGANFLLLIGAVVLNVSSPDWLSALIVGMMAGIVLIGEIFGVFPLIQYSAGFDNAVRNIR